MEDKRYITLGLVWGIAAGTLGMAAVGAFGEIQLAPAIIAAGTAVGTIVGVIIYAVKKSRKKK